MRKSHLLEELKIRKSIQDGQLKLYNFYIKNHHLSKRNAMKKAFGWSDRDIDQKLIQCGKEKAYIEMANLFTK